MTKNAQCILQIINETCEHLSAEDIFKILKGRGNKMVLATVYNNLNALLKQGYIGVICVEGQPDRYDRVKKHDHLVCRKCGKILDVNLKDFTKTIEKNLGFAINSYDLRINYVCDDCKKLSRRLKH